MAIPQEWLELAQQAMTLAGDSGDMIQKRILLKIAELYIILAANEHTQGRPAPHEGEIKVLIR